MPRAGFEPASCRLRVDNGIPPARSKGWSEEVAVVGCDRVAASKPHGLIAQRPSVPEITEPLRPATDGWDRPARGRTRTDEVGARRAPVTPQAFEKPSGRPGRTGLPGAAPRCSAV